MTHSLITFKKPQTTSPLRKYRMKKQNETPNSLCKIPYHNTWFLFLHFQAKLSHHKSSHPNQVVQDDKYANPHFRFFSQTTTQMPFKKMDTIFCTLPYIIISNPCDKQHQTSQGVGWAMD